MNSIDQLHLSPCDTLPRQQITIEANKYGNPEPWTARNSDGRYDGFTTLKNGLANSTNTITARLMADLFKTAGADRLMAVDLHTSQIQGFFDGPVDHLFALPMLANYVGSKVDRTRLTIVSPDSGRVRVAERWSDLLGGCPIAFIHKTRDPRVPNESTTGRVVGDVQGQTCVVIDDMIDTAGTITKAVEALFDAGAADVIIAATHAVLSGPAVERLKSSRASEVVVTNTLPISEDQKFDGLTVLSIAPLLGRAIREVFEDGSVTSLFDGHS